MASPMRHAPDRCLRRADWHWAHGKHLWQRLPFGAGLPGYVKTQQVVDQPLKAANARTGRPCRSAEMCIAKGAILLRHKAVSPEWRRALSTRQAAVAQSESMTKAGYAGRQGPASTEVWRFIFTQAGRTELQPVCRSVRSFASLRQGPQRQSQARKGIRFECHSGKLFGGEHCTVEQKATTAFGQMPVKSCRPVLTRGPKDCSEIAGRYAVGMGKPMQPA